MHTLKIVDLLLVSLHLVCSIINGFALPLKQEHKQFLFKVLMPLHQSNMMNLFHAQVCQRRWFVFQYV